MAEPTFPYDEDVMPIVASGPVLVDRMTVGGVLSDRDPIATSTVTFMPSSFLQPASFFTAASHGAAAFSFYDPYSPFLSSLSLQSIMPNLYQQAATQNALAAAAAQMFMPTVQQPPTVMHPCTVTTRMCQQCTNNAICPAHQHTLSLQQQPANYNAGTSTSTTISQSHSGQQQPAVRIKRPAPSHNTLDELGNSGSDPTSKRQKLTENTMAERSAVNDNNSSTRQCQCIQSTNASLTPTVSSTRQACGPCNCQQHCHCYHEHHSPCASCNGPAHPTAAAATLRQQSSTNFNIPTAVVAPQQMSFVQPNRILSRDLNVPVGSYFLGPANAPMIHPLHAQTLAARQAAAERDRTAQALWYQQRQAVQQHAAAQAAVQGFVNATRIQPPVVMLPRVPMMELSMLVLRPAADALLMNAATAAAAASAEPQPVGASFDMINNCSCTMIFGEQPLSSQEEPERCTICLMDFESGDELRRLHCSHSFHIPCIDRWLVYNKKCPVCRLDLDLQQHHHHHHHHNQQQAAFPPTFF